MSRVGLNRLATTTVIAQNDITTITEATPNQSITANMTSDTTSIAVEQYFITATADRVACTPHTTMTQTNVPAGIEQLETQFSKGSTDPTTGTEPFLDEGDLFYNTNTNQLKVYRGSGTWDILLQAEGDMDTLDGNTF